MQQSALEVTQSSHAPSAPLLSRVLAGALPDRLAFAITCSFGAVLALCVFGVDYVLGRGDYWSYPVGDVASQLLGFRYFTADTWHFPLLRTTLADPAGVNVLFLDTIPLVALPSKLLAPLLGPHFNPFGVWMVVCYALQAHFASRVVRALGHRSLIATLAASTLALSCHTFLSRFFHQDLSAMFLLLWAFCLYFEGARIRGWATLLVVALLVHPYLLVMTALIFVAACVKRRQLGVFGAVIAIVTATGVLTGHVSTQVLAARSGGYGLPSLNLGSLVVPVQDRSAIWPHVPSQMLDRTGMQWDGSFFLGFGVLALLVLHLIVSRRRIAGAMSAHWPLVAAVGLMFLYAPANHVYLFGAELFHYEIPQRLGWLTDQFRSTGRFAWPAGFLVVLAVVPLTLRHFKAPTSTFLLLTCGVVQLCDGIPVMRMVRDHTSHAWSRRLDWPAWRAAIAAHKRVDQWPSFQCTDDLGREPSLLTRESREIEFMAAELARPINGIRAGRETKDCAHETFTPLATRDGTLSLYVRADAPAALPTSCRAVALWVVCSDRWQAPQMAALRAAAALDTPPSPIDGARLDFGVEKWVTPFLTAGWGRAEGDHIWVGSASRLDMQVAPGSYWLELDGLVARAGTLTVRVGGRERMRFAIEPGRGVWQVRIARRFTRTGRLQVILASGENTLALTGIKVRLIRRSTRPGGPLDSGEQVRQEAMVPGPQLAVR